MTEALSATTRSVRLPAAVALTASALLLGVGVPAQASATGNPATARSAAAPAAAAPAAPASSGYPAAPAATGSAATYTVRAGDTLNQIAAAHSVSLATVLSLNGLAVTSIIYPGDVLVLSGAAGAPAAPPVSGATAAAPETAPPVAAPPVPAPPAAARSGSTGTSAEFSVTTAASDVTEIPATSTNAAILASANAQLGAVQDCTVLGEQALRAAGISGVGDESPESLMKYATPVSNPQPGDFIYYADGGMGFSHNAVYIGNGQAIHSGWNGNQTVVNSVDIGSGPTYYRVNA